MDRRTLVLTRWYLPIQIVTSRDAIVDLYLGKVESVIDYNEEIRSPSVSMKVPAVIRILRKTDKIKRGVKFSKVNVATRDGFRCQYCLTRLPLSKLHYDHVFPKSRGGETIWENIVCSCQKCNSHKANRTPEEAGMQLHTKPRKPHSLPVEPLHVSGPDVPQEWMGFVQVMA